MKKTQANQFKNKTKGKTYPHYLSPSTTQCMPVYPQSIFSFTLNNQNYQFKLK